MNVIICNRKKDMLNNLNIDIIKKVEGEFDADEIIAMFKNFYYQRMILDITAIKNYNDIVNLQKLSISLDMDKVILLLDDNDASTSPDYLSKLISMGIYNFTRNAEGILYLYNNPNSYRDVAQYHRLDTQSTTVEQPQYQQPQQIINPDVCRIIGVKNLTKETGTTTFTYLMVKALKKCYDVVGVQADANDFMYFNDKNLFSVSGRELSKFIENNNKRDAIIIDLNNDVKLSSLAQEIIYLVEPSVLKLNKLLNEKRTIFKDVEGKRVILNQSMLTNREVGELEYEAKTKFFFNMPPINERNDDLPMMDAFLNKLGFDKIKPSDGRRKGLFG